MISTILALNPIQGLLPESLVHAFGWMILHSLWQSSLVALMLALAMVALRSRSAQMRYTIAVGALALVVAASVVTFTHYYQQDQEHQAQEEMLQERVFAELEAGTPVKSATKPTMKVKTAPAITGSSTAAAATPVQSTAQAPAEGIWSRVNDLKALPTIAGKTLNETSVQNAITTFQEYFNRHLPLIVTLWFVGVVVLTLKLLSGLAYAQRLKNYRTTLLGEEWQQRLQDIAVRVGLPASLRATVSLVESRLARVPMVLGALKPVILLPISMMSGLSNEQVEIVLAHELAHIARRDYIVNIVQSFVEVVMFYHPAVWWISGIVREEREHCCDDIAVQACGDSFALANALVTLQDRAWNDASPAFQPAMAATGNNNGRDNGQLMKRIKRLLGLSTSNRRISSSTVAACLLLCAVSLSAGVLLRPVVERTAVETFGAAVGFVEKPFATIFVSSKNTAADSSHQTSVVADRSEMRWKARFKETSMTLVMRGSDRNNVNINMDGDGDSWDGWNGWWSGRTYSNTLPYSKFDGLTAAKVQTNGSLTFQMTKPQGVFTFTGESRNGKGMGSYSFAPSGEFLSKLQAHGFPNASTNDLEILAFSDVKLETMQELGGLGLSVEDASDLALRGIKPEYIKAAKAAGMTAGEIEEFGVRGIKPEYVKTMKEAGFTQDEIEEIGVRGISVETAKGYKQAGFSGDDIAELAVRGIKADYVKAMKEAGFNTDEIAEIGVRGISAETAKMYKQAGFEGDDIADLGVRGIKPEYVKTMKEAGFSKDEIQELGVRGISMESAKAYKQAGFSGDDIQELAVRGIKAETAKAYREAGFNTDDIADLAVRGIKPDYVTEMKKAGFSKDDIQEIGVRGIKVEIAKAFKQAGFDADEIADLAVRGIKVDYVVAMKKAGFSKDDIEDIGVRGISVETAKDLKKQGFSADEIAELGVLGIRSETLKKLRGGSSSDSTNSNGRSTKTRKTTKQK